MSKSLNLCFRNLTEIPKDLPQDLEELDLSNNEIYYCK